MNKALVLMMGLAMLMAGMSGLVVGAPTAISKPAESPVVDVKLDVPAGSKLFGMMPKMGLDISPETNMAVVVVSTMPDASSPRMEIRAMLADLKTGKLSSITDLVGKAEQGQAVGADLSPDRKHLLVNWVGPKNAGVYAIELPNGKPVKVAEGQVEAIWAGDKIAVSTITQEGKLAKISLADPATGKLSELPVRGMVAASLPDGTLIVGGNPKAPAAELSAEEAEAKGRLFRVGIDGKVLADLAPMGIVSSPPVVSRGGKFIAFQSKPAGAPEGPGTKYGLTILSVDGKDKQELAKQCLPVAVMDDGSAIVFAMMHDENHMAPISLVSKDGKTVKELAKAVTAAVIGKSVIYAVNGDKPAIRTTSLPNQ